MSWLKRLSNFGRLGLIALLALGILTACGSGDEEATPEPTVTRVTVEGAPTAVPQETDAEDTPADETPDGEAENSGS